MLILLVCALVMQMGRAVAAVAISASLLLSAPDANAVTTEQLIFLEVRHNHPGPAHGLRLVYREPASPSKSAYNKQASWCE